jgi:hypothetical protein
MATKVFNVRLSPEDAKRVQALRKAGVALSSLVRSAIRAEHERLYPRPKWRSARELLERLYAEFPPPPPDATAPKRGSDRKSMQRAIRERLQAKHRRTIRDSPALAPRTPSRRRAG